MLASEWIQSAKAKEKEKAKVKAKVVAKVAMAVSYVWDVVCTSGVRPAVWC